MWQLADLLDGVAGEDQDREPGARAHGRDQGQRRIGLLEGLAAAQRDALDGVALGQDLREQLVYRMLRMLRMLRTRGARPGRVGIGIEASRAAERAALEPDH